jgi:hypothetical protein
VGIQFAPVKWIQRIELIEFSAIFFGRSTNGQNACIFRPIATIYWSQVDTPVSECRILFSMLEGNVINFFWPLQDG